MEKVVMNLCFLIGEINSEINFNFILNSKNISVASFELEINVDSKVEVKAYDEMADWCYQNLARNDVVLIQGKLTSGVEIVTNKVECLVSE